MSRPLVPLRVGAAALLAVALAGAAGAAATAATGPSATSSTEPVAVVGGSPTPLPPATKVVRYRSVSVRVPDTWPVVDLDTSPHSCVRLDIDAVYLGTPAAQQDCPAHLVGRGNTVWLGPSATAQHASLLAQGSRRPSAACPPRSTEDARSQQRQIDLPSEGVVVRTAWGTDPSAVQDAVATIAPAVGPPPAQPNAPASTTTGGTTPAAYLTADRSAAPAAAAAVAATGKVLTGMAFDTCAAPSVASMSAWRKSPYAAVGIYIGGSMRACGDGNLSASWVSTVTSQGWGLIPIYVGLQAPCATQSGLAAHLDDPQHGRVPGQGGRQRRRGPGQAVRPRGGVDPLLRHGVLRRHHVVHERRADLPHGLDHRSCTPWGTARVRTAAPGSLITDMSKAVAAHSASFTAPDQVWFAHWNGLQTTSDSGSYPAFADAYWASHARLHQYAGASTQSWGGVSISIDQNWVDATLPGNAVQTSYGTNILGPGSAGFGFTGDMAYWRPWPPIGVPRPWG